MSRRSAGSFCGIGFLALLVFFSKAGFADDRDKKPVEIVKVPSIPVTVPHYPDPSIAEIQRQLQDIIQIRQTLQAQHLQDMAELRRIIDQAQAHRQILNELAQARRPVGKEAQVEEAIRWQKVKLIEEQVSRNRQTIEELKKERPAEVKKSKES